MMFFLAIKKKSQTERNDQKETFQGEGEKVRGRKRDGPTAQELSDNDASLALALATSSTAKVVGCGAKQDSSGTLQNGI